MYVICATCAMGLMASTNTGMITCASHPKPVAGSTLILNVLCTQMLAAHRIMPIRKLGVDAPATDSNTISDDPGPRRLRAAAMPSGKPRKIAAIMESSSSPALCPECLAHQLDPGNVRLRPEVAGRVVDDVLCGLAQRLPGGPEWFYRKVLSPVLGQDQSPRRQVRDGQEDEQASERAAFRSA